VTAGVEKAVATGDNTPRVLALDLSLTRTGVCDINGHASTLRCSLDGALRLNWYYHRVREMLAAQQPDVLVVEGYSFASKYGGERLGELHGAVQLAALHTHCPLVEVPPTVLKMYATGKGNASKDMVLVAAAQRFPDFNGDNNAADALWLWALAMAVYGRPVVELPALHLRAVRACPTLPPLGDRPPA
jgi:crossover junction endodeoxyribonuclease RuvC